MWAWGARFAALGHGEDTLRLNATVPPAAFAELARAIQSSPAAVNPQHFSSTFLQRHNAGGIAIPRHAVTLSRCKQITNLGRVTSSCRVSFRPTVRARWKNSQCGDQK